MVHDRLRHRQRGLLPAGRYPADPRPRVYRRRPGRVLVRGQAQRELHAAAAGARCAGGRDRARAPALYAAAAHHPRPAPRRAGRSSAGSIRPTGGDDLGLYVLVAPHLGATGYDNVATVERYRSRRVLLAEQGPFGMALAAVDQHQARCVSARQRRLCRQQRRLAGFRAQRRDDLAIPHRRAGQCRADGRIAAPRACWRSASAAAPKRPRRWRYRA